MNISAERFRIEPRPLLRPDVTGHPDVTAMIAAIQQFYVGLYGGPDEDSTDPDDFTPPDGLFLLGYLDDVPVASGGWRRRAAGTTEIKRMYTVDAVRGQGLGRLMLAELERTAAAAGSGRMVLNTGSRQTAAIALYESAGYRRTADRYGYYADLDGAFFFTKTL